MAEHLLTDTKLRTYRAKGKEVTLSDGGGLIVRCRDDSVIFFYRYKRPDDERREAKISLGAYPSLSLAAARQKRDGIRAQVADGIDPQVARKDDAARRRLDLLERVARNTTEDTFNDWNRLYVQVHRNPAGRKETTRLWKKDILSTVGAIPLVDVQKHHIIETLDHVVERGSIVQAGHVLSEIRQFFDWALGRGLVSVNPTVGIKKKSIVGTRRSGERTLSFPEVHSLLVDKLPAAALTPPSSQAVRLLLATGCRVGELLAAQWTHIDLEKGIWTMPTSKSGRPHVIHLSEFAKTAFSSIGVVDDSAFVFPARGKVENGANPKRITKQVADRQQDAPGSNRTKTTNRALVLPGGYWTPHDLRRTMASRLADLGVDYIVIELMLNHELQGVAGIYQRSGRLPERRAAHNKWGDLLTRIETGTIDLAELP